jgi:WD40 repeat protein
MYQNPLIQYSEPSATYYSTDSTLLAIGFRNGILRLFNTRDGSIVNEWNGAGKDITTLAFSQYMKYMASASTDGTIRIWGIWG